jgi:hypothetical protein
VPERVDFKNERARGEQKSYLLTFNFLLSVDLLSTFGSARGTLAAIRSRLVRDLGHDHCGLLFSFDELDAGIVEGAK